MKGFAALGIALLATAFTACGVINERVARMGPEYPPYTGKVEVFWKEHGVPDPNRYTFLGTVSGRVLQCGVIQARLYEGLHKRLIERAAGLGGNGVILYCGEIGTVDSCYCYGDVIRLNGMGVSQK